VIEDSKQPRGAVQMSRFFQKIQFPRQRSEEEQHRQPPNWQLQLATANWTPDEAAAQTPTGASRAVGIANANQFGACVGSLSLVLFWLALHHRAYPTYHTSV
jgi:hypothetical protein